MFERQHLKTEIFFMGVGLAFRYPTLRNTNVPQFRNSIIIDPSKTDIYIPTQSSGFSNHSEHILAQEDTDPQAATVAGVHLSLSEG